MKFLATLLFLVFTLSLSAQSPKDIYLKEGAEMACSCMTAEENSIIEEVQMKLGLCLLEFVNSDRDRYETFYGPLDFTDEKSMENMGADFGVMMMSVCPETMMALAEGSMGEEEEEQADELSTVSGTIVSISNDEFTVVTVRENSGRPVKLLWLDYFPGAELLTEADSGQTLNVSFVTRDIYNGKTAEYVTRRVLMKITK